MLTRPDRSEYADFYANYIARVPEGPVEDFLLKQYEEIVSLVKDLSEEAASLRPAPGKWSVKEVLGHLCDTERVMTYRALRFARGDAQELRGFEQDDYVVAGEFNARLRHDLLVELKNIRGATIALFGSISPEAGLRSGIANGHPVSVRALAYIVAGHAQHHYELLKARG
jgi:hypothetical protein